MEKRTIEERCKSLVDEALNPDAMFFYINSEFGEELGEICTVLDPDYPDLLAEQFGSNGQAARVKVDAIEAQVRVHVLEALAERLR